MNVRHRLVHFRLGALHTLALVLSVAPLATAAPAEVRPIALSGRAAPGAGGAIYSQIFSGTAVVNDHDQVAFEAQLSGGGVTNLNNLGLWLGDSLSSQSLLARSGNQPAGLPAGVTFSGGFEPPSLNNHGEVTFIASIEPALQPIEDGAWTTAGGTLRLLAADRYPLPNVPGTPSVLRGVWNASINDAGQSVFFAPLATSSSFYVDTPGQPLRRVVSQGDALPGGSGLQALELYTPRIADNGRISFTAEGTGSPNYYTGIWSEVSGTLRLIARGGDTSPSIPGIYNSIYNATMSPNGLIAFDAFTSAGPPRIMVAQRTDGTLRLVASTNTTIAGSPFTFTNFYEPRINTLGRVAFPAYLSGYPSTALPTSVWFEDPLGLHMLTRGGQVAPGTGGATFNEFQDIAFNDNGDLMFEAYLTDGVAGVTSANDQGLWLRDRTGLLTLIARTGDTIDIAPGPTTDLRQIASLDSIGDYGNIRQQRRTLTNQGEVLFWAQFTDGTTGLFLSHPVPEPGSLVIALILSIAAAGSRFARK